MPVLSLECPVFLSSIILFSSVIRHYNPRQSPCANATPLHLSVLLSHSMPSVGTLTVRAPCTASCDVQDTVAILWKNTRKKRKAL